MKQNEIWPINLDPTIGAEIKKTRLAIIIIQERIKSAISKVLSIQP